MGSLVEVNAFENTNGRTGCVFSSPVGNAFDASFLPNCRDAVVAIPGQYQTTVWHFQDPRPDLHVKHLRMLPTLRRVVGQTDVVHYRVQMLGENGISYPFDVQLTSESTEMYKSVRSTVVSEVIRHSCD
jgi:hypothetical protein